MILFTGKMSSVIKKNAGRGGVSAPRGGGAQRMEEKPDKKDAGNDDINGESSHCATSRVGREI